MVNAPEKIRVAQDSDGFWTCREAISGSQEYVRADLVAELEAENEWLKHALEAANKRADEAEARRKCYECGSEMTACARCNPELPTAELTALSARVAELEDCRNTLLDALADLRQWADSYPLNIFPEPDFARAAKALADAGMTIDAISASNMRHVLSRVKTIADAALKGVSHEQ